MALGTILPVILILALLGANPDMALHPRLGLSLAAASA